MTALDRIDDVVGLLAADVRQRRERAITRGGPIRGWQSLVDVAAALDAVRASGAAGPRECAAMRRMVRAEIARAAPASAPVASPELAERAACLLQRADSDAAREAIVELGLAGLHGRLLPEPPWRGAVEPVFQCPPVRPDLPDRNRLERVLIAPAPADGGVRLCSVECYADAVVARYAQGAGHLPSARLTDDVGSVYGLRGGGISEAWWWPGVPPSARQLRVRLGRLDVELPLGSGREPSADRPSTRQMSVADAIDRHLWRRLLLVRRWRGDEFWHLPARLQATVDAMIALGLLDSAAARTWTARIDRAERRRRRSSAQMEAGRAAGAHLAGLVERMRDTADESDFASELIRVYAAAGTLELAGLVSERSAEDARAAARIESWAREPRRPNVKDRPPGPFQRVIAGPRRRAGPLRVTSVEVHDTCMYVQVHHDGALSPPQRARPWPAVFGPAPALPERPMLADDAGTRYAVTSASSMGAGLELEDVWTGTMTVQPAPPRSARRLTLTYAGRTIAVRL